MQEFGIWKLRFQSRYQAGFFSLCVIPNRITETFNKDNKCMQYNRTLIWAMCMIAPWVE